MCLPPPPSFCMFSVQVDATPPTRRPSSGARASVAASHLSLSRRSSGSSEGGLSVGSRTRRSDSGLVLPLEFHRRGAGMNEAAPACQDPGLAGACCLALIRLCVCGCACVCFRLLLHSLAFAAFAFVLRTCFNTIVVWAIWAGFGADEVWMLSCWYLVFLFESDWSNTMCILTMAVVIKYSVKL